MLIDVLEGVAKVVQHKMLCGNHAHQVHQVDAHGRDLLCSINLDTWLVVRDLKHGSVLGVSARAISSLPYH